MSAKYQGFRWPNASERLLLRAATADGPAAAEAWNTWLASNDLDDTTGLAYSVVPQVAQNLQRSGVDVPEAGRLKGMLHRTWYDNKLATHAAAQALAVLNEAGIGAMLLKGGALLATRTGGAAARTMNDVDILVRPQDARRAAALLLARGWRIGQVPVEGLDLLHAIELVGPGGRSVDLHRSMLEDNAVATADRGAWERSRHAEISGVPTRVPSVEDLLVSVCIHGTRAMPSPTLRWALDARDLILDAGTEMRWDTVVAVARQRKATLAIFEALSYVRDELGVPVPQTTLNALRDSRRGLLERLDYHAQGNKNRVPFAVMSTFTRYLRRDTDRPLWRRLVDFPRFLQLLWEVDSLLKVPGIGLRRVRALRAGTHEITQRPAARITLPRG